MELTGGCYCRAVRYEISGEVLSRGLCHCRECQYITGGGANVAITFPADGFRYTQGEPKSFTRPDLETPVTREFCGNCGTHLTTRAPIAPGMVIVKVGSLDDPSVFGMPQIAIFMSESQPHHCVPEGVPQFEKFPPIG